MAFFVEIGIIGHFGKVPGRIEMRCGPDNELIKHA